MANLTNLVLVGSLLLCHFVIIIHGLISNKEFEHSSFPRYGASEDKRRQTYNIIGARKFSDLKNKSKNFSFFQPIWHSCPHRDSCQRMTGKKFSERNCECDGFCSFFGDCCLFKDTSKSILHLRSWWNTCMAYGISQDKAMYVVGTCPARFNDTKIKKFCEGEDDFSDPLLSVPVTDMYLGRTYRNRYCALCNGHLTSDIRSWEMAAVFENSPPRISDKRNVLEAIEFNSHLRKWGIYHDGNFYVCQFRFVKPSYIPVLRECRPNMIISCPPTYQNQYYIRACGMYMSAVYSRGRLYKNPHCAICNGEKYAFCIPPRKIVKRSTGGIMFPHLMDFNWSEGNYVGSKSICNSKSIYDPFSNKCREIVCIFDNYELINGECRKKKNY